MINSTSSDFKMDFCEPMPDIASYSESASLEPTSPKVGREPINPTLLPDHVLKEQETLKSGYVDKRYRIKKTWKTRWLVLRGHQLSVYKDDKEYELLYHIELFNTSALSEVAKKRRKFVFGIVTPKKLFYFQCATAEERDSWLTALCNARDSLPAHLQRRDNKIAIVSSTDDEVEGEMNENMVPLGPEDSKNYSDSQNQLGSCSSYHSDSYPNQPLDMIYEDSSEYEIEPPNEQDHDVISPFTPNTSPLPIVTLEKLQIGADVAPQVVMQGFLYKHCDGYRAWRRRWFVLRDSQLCYYKDEKEYELHGIIPLNQISGVKLATSKTKNKAFCFKLNTLRRTFKLAASSQIEREKWLEVLQHHCKPIDELSS